MPPVTIELPPRDVDVDPICRLLLSGRAPTAREAERLYLDEALPEAVALLASRVADHDLARHPLMVMCRAHGSRGWEDSVL